MGSGLWRMWVRTMGPGKGPGEGAEVSRWLPGQRHTGQRRPSRKQWKTWWESLTNPPPPPTRHRCHVYRRLSGGKGKAKEENSAVSLNRQLLAFRPNLLQPAIPASVAKGIYSCEKLRQRELNKRTHQIMTRGPTIWNPTPTSGEGGSLFGPWDLGSIRESKD